jgi:hypothetical protein
VTEAGGFLVAYDYGMGALWGVVVAASEGAISHLYPELEIVRARPEWMTWERYESLMSDPYVLDDAPRGLLLAVIADRGRS